MTARLEGMEKVRTVATPQGTLELFPPYSEVDDHIWAADPHNLACEVGASVFRRMQRHWPKHAALFSAGNGQFLIDLRCALDAELSAALALNHRSGE